MSDIATIGFRADTKELAKAEAHLEAMGPAAGKAERGADALGASVARAGAQTKTFSDRVMQFISGAGRFVSAAAQIAAGLFSVGDAAEGATDDINRMKNAANDNVNKVAGGMKANVGNIAAQFQDIGVTAAMGMNPLIIALQQGTQLSAVFAASGESMGKTLATAFASIISPVALLTIGLVALAAAGLQMVNWVSVAQTGLDYIASILPSVAQGAIAVGVALALAFAPAIVSTIWAIATGILTGILPAIMAVVTTIGIVPVAIASLVAAFFIFRDDLNKIFGVDIVGMVKNAANYVIGSFVAAYHDILFVWNNFGNIYGAAIIAGVNLAVASISYLIQKAIDGINLVIRTANSFSNLTGMGDIASEFTFDGLEGIANIAADALTGAVKERNVQLAKDLNADYLGAIGGAITNAAMSAASKIKEFSAGLDDETGKKKKGPKEPKSDAAKFDDIVAGALRSIDALQAERDAIGMSAEATAKLKYETELLNEAQQKNIALSPLMRAVIGDLAEEMARLETETADAQEALDFAKGLFKGFMSDIKSGLEQGKSLWEAFGDAAMNVLNKIVDRLLNDVIDAIFEVMEAGGGWGNFFASIFSNAKGNAFDGGEVTKFAAGGTFTNKVVTGPTAFTMGQMGEAGPEAIMPLSRGPDGKLGVKASGGGGGGGDVLVQVINNSDNSSVRQERSKGEGNIDIIRVIIDKVKDAVVKGEMDGANKQRYAMSPSKIIR